VIYLKLQVLISTMNLKNAKSLIDKMNISTESIIVNQCTEKNIKLLNEKKEKYVLYSFYEKGLSKSRNKAIKYSNADICVIADDDMTYLDNYEYIIKKAYKKYKDADIIAFYVESAPNSVRKKKKLKEGKLGYLSSLKVQSVQVTFKKNSIVNNNISFDELYGAGTDNYMGEENIFLYDCLKKGLKIYSVPQKIAYLHDGESTWFRGFDKKYLEVKGAMFYRMSKLFFGIFILQFALRHSDLFKPDYSKFQMIRYMINGKNKVKKSKKVV